jgi:hypothetical protein
VLCASFDIVANTCYFGVLLFYPASSPTYSATYPAVQLRDPSRLFSRLSDECGEARRPHWPTGSIAMVLLLLLWDEESICPLAFALLLPYCQPC